MDAATPARAWPGRHFEHAKTANAGAWLLFPEDPAVFELVAAQPCSRRLIARDCCVGCLTSRDYEFRGVSGKLGYLDARSSSSARMSRHNPRHSSQIVAPSPPTGRQTLRRAMPQKEHTSSRESASSGAALCDSLPTQAS